MEWYLVLALIFGSFFALLALGVPVAFCFLLVNVVGVGLFFGGDVALKVLPQNIYSSVSTYTLMPVALFLLMGEVMFQSGIALNMIDAMDKWLGRLPGRLGLVAVGAGTALGFLTGVTTASIAILGSNLVPEMEKRGYKKPMSLGPVLGSGGLAMMIPPSAQAILLGVIGEVSIGKLLIAIIMPGVLMAVLYAGYIIIRCQLQPSIAPAYEVSHVPLSEKLLATAKYILPLGIVVFAVVGVILLGIATPSEAAATGALATLILAACYGNLNWQVLKKSLINTTEITIFVFMIIVTARTYTQMLAYSGASQGICAFVIGLPLLPILVLISIQLLLLFLGMFMPPASIMLVTLPLFMPIVLKMGWNPVWFAVIFLLNMEMGQTTPPYGFGLFVMKRVAPLGTTIGHCVRAALPFLGCDAIAMAFIIAFPAIALWLPSIMR